MRHDPVMASMSPNVAVDVVRLAAPIVSLHPRPAILDPVVRAGLLIDLALTGALVESTDGLEVDTDPTGFVPADKLLASVVKHPDKPLAWWLYHAPVNVYDVADELVAVGTWERHGHGLLRRYRPVRPEQRVDELKRLNDAFKHHDAGARDVATACLLDLLPLNDLPGGLGSGPTGKSHTRADWLLPDLLDNLRRQRAILAAAGRDAQAANVFTQLT